MKNLKDYLVESFSNEDENLNEGASSKSITFSFKDLENAKETIESLKGKDGVEASEDSITVTVNADNVDKLGTVQDILQQYCQSIRSSQKRSSDEQYAQKTVEFEKKVGELNDALDEIANPEEEEKKEDKDEAE